MKTDSTTVPVHLDEISQIIWETLGIIQGELYPRILSVWNFKARKQTVTAGLCALLVSVVDLFCNYYGKGVEDARGRIDGVRDRFPVSYFLVVDCGRRRFKFHYKPHRPVIWD